ncbi:MAG: hypothetical protein JXM72_04780 [Deltaproteobacteria bacterium]|nr:hypothetical protein [Deltaproteobacteria bacterium]
MENVITRIVEIEKQCAQDIANAEQEYRKTIEIHKRAIEDKKAKAFNNIDIEANKRLNRAIEDARSKAQADSLAARDSFGRIYKDSSIHKSVKEKIVSIILKI